MRAKKKGFILFHTLLANSTLFFPIDAILPLCFSVSCGSEERKRQISFCSRVFSQKKKRTRQISLVSLVLFAFLFPLNPEQAKKVPVAAAPRSYPMINIHLPPSPSLLLIPIRVQRSGTADCSILHSFQPGSTAFYGTTQKALGNTLVCSSHPSIFSSPCRRRIIISFLNLLLGLLPEQNRTNLP